MPDGRDVDVDGTERCGFFIGLGGFFYFFLSFLANFSFSRLGSLLVFRAGRAFVD